MPTIDLHSSLNLQNGNVESDLNLPIVDLGDTLSATKEDLRELRSSYFDRIPGLLKSEYRLRKSVFRSIEENVPWLSRQGYFFSGPEDTWQSGPPAEGLGLANPLLLIYPDFQSWSVRGALKWNKDLVLKQQAFTRKDFPFSPSPLGLIFSYSKKEFSVNYNLSDYQYLSRQWLLEPLQIKDLTFLPVTYNAKDLGFDWYWLSSESTGIEVLPTSVPRVIVSSIRHTAEKDCGSSGQGCNLRVDSLQGEPVKVTSIPAEAVFFLWEKKPSSAEQKPDMKFRIILQ